MRGTEQKTTLELKLEKLRTICEKSPDNAIGLLALAETAFRRGLRLEALEAYQKVLKDESVAEAHLCMAQMYRHHGLYQEAISELRTLFEMEPGYPEAHVFARELASDTVLPQDIEEILLAGCGNDELALARVRLSIARSLVLREGQELVAIQDANAGDPTFGYYICETRKRLTYCEEVLSQLAVLEEARRAYLADLDRQRQIERERQRAADRPEASVTISAQEVLVQEPVSPLEGTSSQYAVAESEAEFFANESETQVEPASLEGVEEGLEQPASVSYLEVVEDEPIQPQVDSTSHLSIQPEEPVGTQPAAGALWDDHRVYLPPSPEPDPLPVQEDLQVDLTLDLTPTLQGNLPEEAPGDLWEVEPVAVYETSPPPVSPGLHIPEANSYYDSGLGDDLAHPGSPELLPVVEPAVSLPDPTPEPAPAPEPEPVVATAPAARNFPELYAPLLAGLDGLIQTLAKTRSVSSVFLLNREGYAIAEQVKDSIGRDRLSEFITETVAFLEAFAKAPQYWVLECAGGIVVIQSVDSYHYLITIGQTGANFGALRYTMDRVRPNFEQVLQPACPA
ncbi:MAG: tetratricopeptide repeat protein [Vulcanimicrobiota bacterium]